MNRIEHPLPLISGPLFLLLSLLLTFLSALHPHRLTLPSFISPNSLSSPPLLYCSSPQILNFLLGKRPRHGRTQNFQTGVYRGWILKVHKTGAGHSEAEAKREIGEHFLQLFVPDYNCCQTFRPNSIVFCKKSRQIDKLKHCIFTTMVKKIPRHWCDEPTDFSQQCANTSSFSVALSAFRFKDSSYDDLGSSCQFALPLRLQMFPVI